MARGKAQEQRRQAVGLSWLFGAEELAAEELQAYIDTGNAGGQPAEPVPSLMCNPVAMESLEKRYQEMRANGWSL